MQWTIGAAIIILICSCFLPNWTVNGSTVPASATNQALEQELPLFSESAEIPKDLSVWRIITPSHKRCRCHRKPKKHLPNEQPVLETIENALNSYISNVTSAQSLLNNYENQNAAAIQKFVKSVAQQVGTVIDTLNTLQSSWKTVEQIDIAASGEQGATVIKEITNIIQNTDSLANLFGSLATAIEVEIKKLEHQAEQSSSAQSSSGIASILRLTADQSKFLAQSLNAGVTGCHKFTNKMNPNAMTSAGLDILDATSQYHDLIGQLPNLPQIANTLIITMNALAVA